MPVPIAEWDETRAPQGERNPAGQFLFMGKGEGNIPRPPIWEVAGVKKKKLPRKKGGQELAAQIIGEC